MTSTPKRNCPVETSDKQASPGVSLWILDKFFFLCEGNPPPHTHTKLFSSKAVLKTETGKLSSYLTFALEGYISLQNEISSLTCKGYHKVVIAFQTIKPPANYRVFRSLTVPAVILLVHENGLISPIIRNEIALTGFNTAWLSKGFQFHITSYKQRTRR